MQYIAMVTNKHKRQQHWITDTDITDVFIGNILAKYSHIENSKANNQRSQRGIKKIIIIDWKVITYITSYKHRFSENILLWPFLKTSNKPFLTTTNKHI